MSRFFSQRHEALVPYTPGEQPSGQKLIKLNTNESPYPPSPAVLAAAQAEAGRCNLYSELQPQELTNAMAQLLGVDAENVMMTNGSDEALYLSFLAFFDEKRPVAFPDITYGFYTVYADLFHIPQTIIPLEQDFTIDPAKYESIGQNVVIANPNAPTGRMLPLDKIEGIVRSNPDHIVLIDEAYVDFGGVSAVSLTRKYDNLLVVGTFSKSRSLAGARLGYVVGDPALIRDLNTIRYSLNPYNVNRMTAAAGLAALRDNDYYMANCRRIIETRQWVTDRLCAMGFEVLPSATNFILAKTPKMGGRELYTRLREKGILVRYLGGERIREYNRITIGAREEMEAFIRAVEEIIGG